ncbi:aldo/keto reductase [Streptomyces lomondensis]|uniref:NADP-dependent oxidoreductase domain-containing protein n=1 Tax=Streptomyces lomondensis TaxID=68229 RepID=A0ABQ2XSH7_9ACTN|nr:hypothetical protein GCM10010383_72960 [Streptomyces lomondensis]
MLSTLALAWILRRSEVPSAITGASRPEQVHANAAASGVKFSDDLLTAVDHALGGVNARRRAMGQPSPDSGWLPSWPGAATPRRQAYPARSASHCRAGEGVGRSAS